ncbi:LuxR C-terminal-related transcriptional regulator [Streptomyces sp. NPDC057746]|uniref:helix-turn-helix transcriptional regulator n=1 Tax=unclassified Streptomyces TaxID=2593676 RepID=UPI0036CB0C12
MALFDRTLSLPGINDWPLNVREWPSPTASDCAQRECPARPEGTVDGAADLRGPRRVAVGRPCRTRAQRDRESRPARIGLPWLTPQESEVAHLAASGRTNQQIAEKLHLSHRTVSGHLHQVFPTPESPPARRPGRLERAMTASRWSRPT